MLFFHRASLIDRTKQKKISSQKNQYATVILARLYGLILLGLELRWGA